MTLREELLSLAEPAYRDFASALLPATPEKMLGIRIPLLRKIARRLAAGDWRTYLDTASDEYFEERMLQGLTLGYARCTTVERLERMQKFLPKIDNWSVCDSFCMTRLQRADREAVWAFIEPLFDSEKEFEVRVATVTALSNFIDDDHLTHLLYLLGKNRHEGYYARMGVAWAVSVCYVKYPRQTHAWLADNCPLPDWTFNMSIQKIRESYRVAEGAKERLRLMKRLGK